MRYKLSEEDLSLNFNCMLILNDKFKRPNISVDVSSHGNTQGICVCVCV